MKAPVALLTALLVALVVIAAPAAAAPKPIVVPAVDGRVVDQTGTPLQYALVVVTFIGSHQPVGNGDGDVLKLCVSHAMTDGQGVYMLASESFPLLDAEGEKVHFIGARVEFTHQDCEPMTMNLANLSGSSSGVISVFLTAAIEHEGGGFFGALSAGWHAVHQNQFAASYEKALKADVTLQRHAQPAPPTPPAPPAPPSTDPTDPTDPNVPPATDPNTPPATDPNTPPANGDGDASNTPAEPQEVRRTRQFGELFGDER